jgi:hypothetical protein
MTLNDVIPTNTLEICYNLQTLLGKEESQNARRKTASVALQGSFSFNKLSPKRLNSWQNYLQCLWRSTQSTLSEPHEKSWRYLAMTHPPNGLLNTRGSYILTPVWVRSESLLMYLILYKIAIETKVCVKWMFHHFNVFLPDNPQHSLFPLLQISSSQERKSQPECTGQSQYSNNSWEASNAFVMMRVYVILHITLLLRY